MSASSASETVGLLRCLFVTVRLVSAPCRWVDSGAGLTSGQGDCHAVCHFDRGVCVCVSVWVCVGVLRACVRHAGTRAHVCLSESVNACVFWGASCGAHSAQRFLMSPAVSHSQSECLLFPEVIRISTPSLPIRARATSVALLRAITTGLCLWSFSELCLCSTFPCPDAAQTDNNHWKSWSY
jgi:hypothetical protein